MHDEIAIVLVSLMSPFCEARHAVRELVAPDEFFQIGVNAPLLNYEKRDSKKCLKSCSCW